MASRLHSLRRTSTNLLDAKDVKIYCGDVFFEGHKIILARNSPYLKNLFEQEMKRDITITPSDLNCTPIAVASLLNFIYTKQIDFKIDKISLLAAARILKIKDATQKIIDQILNNINIAQFLTEFHAVSKYGKLSHKKKFIECLAIHFEALIRSEQFVQLTRDELVSILGCKHQMSPSTDRVIQGILKWINHEKEGRERYFPHLLSLIDVEELPLLSIANLNEEDPIVANKLVSILCEKIWRRDEVIVFNFEFNDKFEAKSDPQLHFLDPVTNSWLSIDRKLPKTMLTEGTICNWRNYIYSISKTSVIVYNIETDFVSEIKAELSCYEQICGTLMAIENVFYYAIDKRLEKYDLKASEKTWISLPNPPKDFVDPNVFYYRNFLYFINDNLLIQKFDLITEKWLVIDAVKIQDSDSFVMYEKSGRIYMMSIFDKGVLRILNLDLMCIESINIDFCGSADNPRLIFIQEFESLGLLKLVVLDVSGNQSSQIFGSFNFEPPFSSTSNSSLLGLKCFGITKEALNFDGETSCENMSPLSPSKYTSFITNNRKPDNFVYQSFHANVNIKHLLTSPKNLI